MVDVRSRRAWCCPARRRSLTIWTSARATPSTGCRWCGPAPSSLGRARRAASATTLPSRRCSTSCATSATSAAASRATTGSPSRSSTPRFLFALCSSILTVNQFWLKSYSFSFGYYRSWPSFTGCNRYRRFIVKVCRFLKRFTRYLWVFICFTKVNLVLLDFTDSCSFALKLPLFFWFWLRFNGGSQWISLN